MIVNIVGYRTEGGKITKDEQEISNIPDYQTEKQKILEFIDFNSYMYYRDIFCKNKHANLLGIEGDRAAFAISLLKDEQNKTWKVIIRSVERDDIPCSQVTASWWRNLLGLEPSYYDVVKTINWALPVKQLKLISDSRLPAAIVNLEERQTFKGFKFGLMYAKEGQTKEDELFSNTDTSPEYEEFLDFIGERVNLQNWTNWRAGLDTSSTGTTGRQSVYNKWNSIEIMWHVATLLPFSIKDKQQLERKRHIGNDTVILVFQEGSTPFKPQIISSRQVPLTFVEVIFVIRPENIKGERRYRLAVITKDGAPAFGPPIPDESLYPRTPEFKDFLYTKLLHAEKASYEAPVLCNKLARTREALLKDMVSSFL